MRVMCDGLADDRFICDVKKPLPLSQNTKLCAGSTTRTDGYWLVTVESGGPSRQGDYHTAACLGQPDRRSCSWCCSRTIRLLNTFVAAAARVAIQGAVVGQRQREHLHWLQTAVPQRPLLNASHLAYSLRGCSIAAIIVAFSLSQARRAVGGCVATSMRAAAAVSAPPPHICAPAAVRVPPPYAPPQPGAVAATASPRPWRLGRRRGRAAHRHRHRADSAAAAVGITTAVHAPPQP